MLGVRPNLCPPFAACPADPTGRRQELLQGSHTLDRGLSRLEQGHRTLTETEAMGNDVLVNLQKQRQQLKSAQCVDPPRLCVGGATH